MLKDKGNDYIRWAVRTDGQLRDLVNTVMKLGILQEMGNPWTGWTTSFFRRTVVYRVRNYVEVSVAMLVLCFTSRKR
jgi:hypothetical protein